MKTILCLLIVALAGTVSAQEEDLQFIDNVAVLQTVDGFTDENTQLFVIAPIGETVTANVPDRSLSIACTNGAMDAMIFGFDIYLNSGELGTFERRLDGGEVKTTEEWQSDSSVTLFATAEGLATDREDIKDILSGTELLVRATGFDGDTDNAEFNLTSLKSVMSQIGCSQPQ
jgi:hypothetical protein